METQVRTVEKKGLNALDVALVAVLLAVGAVLRMFIPPFFGITPNLVIGMYCLAILLIRPKFVPIIGIGLVAAAICQLTTKSLFPYLNFISEPIGALVVGLLSLINFEAGFLKYIRPMLITFFGTVASGLSYVSIFKVIALLGTVPKNPAFSALLYVVFVTAFVNCVVATILYFPLKAALSKTR